MAATDTGLRVTDRVSVTIRRDLTLLLLIAFSLYYFANVLLLSSEKYFWFDELATLYVCRLPNFHTLWNGLRHGVDLNPPFFFLLTNASKALFGENRIGLRMPEMIGFWILCLCLYRFVSRRAGLLAGAIAMVLPTLTGAFYYAYEARPHGIVLGFTGLALVCWQMSLERPGHRRWLVAFSACLLGAALMHCYAVLLAMPFGAAELVSAVQRRRIDIPRWIALIAPASIASFTYIPLLFSYRTFANGTDYAAAFAPNIARIASFYSFLLGPCIVTVVLVLAVLAIDRIINTRWYRTPSEPSRNLVIPDGIVASFFLALPILGLILAVLVRGPFFARYFTSAALGLCILIGLSAGARQEVNWVAIAIATFIAFPVSWQFSALLWHRYHGIAESIVESSSDFQMNVTLEGPLARYPKLLLQGGDSRPIAVSEPVDYIYLLHYASPELRSRLYYARRSKNDFFYAALQRSHSFALFPYNKELTPEEFLHLSPHLLVMGRLDDLDELSRLLGPHRTVPSLHLSENKERFIAELETDRENSH